MDELLQEFIAETRETLEALAGEVVAWEADPADAARLDAIFRFVHTVKGSCGFLDLPRLAKLSHAAEDVLAAARAGERVPDQPLVNAVLAVIDRIGSLVETLDAGGEIGTIGDDDLIAALAEGGTVVAAEIGAPRAPARSVRVSVDLLDRMMGGMSDMVLARNELARRLRDGDVDPGQEAALARLSATVAELRDTVTRTRMQTIDALFSMLPRLVRDTAANLGKSVSLAIEGADVELDREMIEAMRDPLMHIVRNAIDHGIEAPALRRAAGKRENGRLTVAARQSGNQVIVEVSDDGAGIDTARLIKKLVSRGRNESELRALSEQAKLQLIFEPGLSSRDDVTDVSGRGVGMDVVRATVEPLGGRIELDNAPGRGLTIALHMPLTLSIIPTVVVAVGTQHYALPRQAVEEILSSRSEAVRFDVLGTSTIATIRERRLPLIDLGELLGNPAEAPRGMLAVVSIKGGSYAMAVDQVLDTEELVIKPAAPGVMASGLFAGQTLPDTGRPMLMLDCAGLAAAAGLQFSRQAAVIEEVSEAQPRAQALLARDLDGELRAVPLALVDRVDTIVDRSALGHSAGRLRLLIDDRLVPAIATGSLDGYAQLTALRLTDGVREAAYIVAEPLDIVDLPSDIVAASAVGPILGVTLVDGERVELLDPHWLLYGDGEAAIGNVDDAPVCLIDRVDPWASIFLRPMLEQAGYRVVDRLPAGTRADISLGSGAADITLRTDPTGQGGVYRFDRAAILAAVADRLAARKVG